VVPDVISASCDPGPSTSGEFRNIPVATVNTPFRPIHSAGAPIGTNVREATKRKIWEHKFIELHELIHHDNPGYTMALSSTDDSPMLTFIPKKKRPLTQTEWGSAFDVYIAVYVQRYPAQLNDILSYAQHIKELMRSNSNWAYYDTRYRQDREFKHCSWLTVRKDLELWAFRQPVQPAAINTPRNERVPRGHCFKYHSRGSYCSNGSNCRFKHQCPRCTRNHPAYAKCNQQNQQTSNKPNATAISPKPTVTSKGR